jgi:hypothetical protein
MLKFPLLCSKLEKPIALLLFGALLSLGMPGTPALAAGEDAGQPPSAMSGAGAVAEPAEKPAPENPVNKALESERPAAAGASSPEPADAKPEAAEAQGKPAEPSAPETPANAAAGAKPAGAKADSAAQKPAEPKEAGAAGKPRDLTPKLDGGQPVAVKPSTVNALYDIRFLGAHVGDFKIHSSITQRQYSMQATADISVLFGAFSWKGVTSSHGLMTGNGPAPQTYNFRYATSEKREAVELRFQQRMVSDIIINPPSHPSARAVPITAADLQNVVDPLSAIALLSLARPGRLAGGDACNKRLPIFDGKMRYDLVLSPKGTRQVSEGRLRGTAQVCRVSYVPIAGHKAGKSSDYASGNSGIEIWLVPVPEAGLLIPYYVQVPTPAGTASMVSVRFNVDTSAGRHAAAE